MTLLVYYDIIIDGICKWLYDFMKSKKVNRMFVYWITLTKSFYIQSDFNTINDLNAIRNNDDPFLLNLYNIPTENNQKSELTVQLQEQMICCDKFSMGDSI
ncbi:MAG: hypothetical protein ACTHME_10390 [Candidatus Nitrosocosmicus sp.]